MLVGVGYVGIGIGIEVWTGLRIAIDDDGEREGRKGEGG